MPWEATHIRTGNVDPKLLTQEQKQQREFHYLTKGKYTYREVEETPQEPKTVAPEPIEAKRDDKLEKTGPKRGRRKGKTQSS